MATQQSAFLPTVAEIEVADEKIGSYLSDLNSFAHMVRRAAGEDEVSLEDAAFLCRNGIRVGDDSRTTIPEREAFLRLLVLANETVNDAETIVSEAAEIRAGLLSIYRDAVLDRPESRQEASAAVRAWHREEAETDA